MHRSESECHSMPHAFNSLARNGSNAPGLAFNFPLSVPGLRRETGLIATSRPTGSLPRVIMTSFPPAASFTSCETIILALQIVYLATLCLHDSPYFNNEIP